MTLFQRLGAGVMAAALLCPLWAHAGDDWKHGKKLSFDTTATGGDLKEAVSQVPVLVRLHSGNFTFSEAKPDGSDLRFFAGDNKTPLKFHLERYDATNELAMAWVQVPKIAANAKSDAIWVRWGNEKAEAAQDSKGTYDATQVFQLNFSEKDGFKDATGNAIHPGSSSAKPLAAGPIAGAASFDGQGRIVLPAAPALKVTASEGWTFTAWVKPQAVDSGSLMSMGPVAIELQAGVPVLKSASGSAQGSTALKAGVWQHLAVVVAGGKAQFYVNGAPAGETPFSAADASGDVILGQGLRGDLDAVGLSRSARSPAYIKVLASTESADSPMMAFADEDDGAEGEETSYFSILIGAVTVDGWVVIGILGIMAAISLYVMVTKTINLSRAEKANQIFLDIFKQKSIQLLTPEHSEIKALQSMKAVQASSIYQLYTLGLGEITQRFAHQSQKQQAQALSATALESIRATLDAAIVRANQRFNSGIVLLTIAISGGPFLGLLGTVVGVMITFAAIAAAGDVNVNSIAPGIAAALVATVAGLAVAIPALFAYNWFAIKIKNIGADTQVFADEFLTKSAELHAAP